MKLFTVKLTDEHRALLERHRQSFGLRSEADAVRHLIETSPNARADIGAKRAVKVPGSVLEADVTPGSVQLGPHRPKPGSRLKKEKR